jgi:lipoprotein-anchoring transpeptidase ErfK/SrfK
MAWTMGSRRVVRVLGWLVPALATLITPSALAQNPVDLAHGVESQASVQRADATLGHPAVDAAPTQIRVKRQVVVSVPDRKLVVMQEGAVLRVFEVAVGADVSPSPSGTFEIVRRLTEPTYYHAGVVIPAGDDNPLGPRWVGLNKKGYGIHGTNAPRSIGKAASHGCIRMRNRDIVQFFAMVSVGDTVEIHAQRDEQVAEIFGGQASEPTEVAQAEASSTGAAGGQ